MPSLVFVRHPSPKPTQNQDIKNPIVDPAAAAAAVALPSPSPPSPPPAAATAPLVAAAHHPLVKRVIDRALAHLRRPSNTTSASLSAPSPVARRPSPVARVFFQLPPIRWTRICRREGSDCRVPGGRSTALRFMHLPIPKCWGSRHMAGTTKKSARGRCGEHQRTP